METLAFSIFTHLAAGIIAIGAYRAFDRRRWKKHAGAGGVRYIDLGSDDFHSVRCRYSTPEDDDDLQAAARWAGV